MMKSYQQGSEGFPANEAVPPTEGGGTGPSIDEVD